MKNTGIIYEGIHPSSVMIGGDDLPDLLISGDWSAHRPVFETQRKFGLDTMNCVQCSRAKLCEYYANFYGIPLNISERFWYWLTGCTANGNTYSACDYHIRQGGALADPRWPWDKPMTREEYGQEPPADLRAEAEKFFEVWTFGQLRYVPNTVEAMSAALKKGPLWFCNDVHSMVMEKIDDRLRVFDTEANATNGIGSFSLDYAPQIVACYLAPFTPKHLAPTPPMAHLTLPENTLVTGYMSNGLALALHVGGKLLLDLQKAEIFSAWVARNENPATHRFEGGPTRTISETDWNSFPHVNLKGQPLP